MFLNPCFIRVPSVAQFIAVVLSLFAYVAARAENIDLSTVPRRDTVQLTIYNTEDLTLVRETRTVTFKKGVESAPVQLGQYADRPHVGRAAIPHASPTS